MKKFIILILSLSINCSLQAASKPPAVKKESICKNPVTKIEAGEISPCTGYLFSPEKEQEVREKVSENEILKEEIKLKDLKIDYLKENVKLTENIAEKESEKAEKWRQLAEKSTEALQEVSSSSSTNDLIMIGLGVLITIGAGVALEKVSN